MADLESWLAEENSIIQKVETEKQAYLYEWLDRLNQQIKDGSYTAEDIKRCQSKLVATLHKLVTINICPATRQQLAKCFATIFHTGTTLGLFDSVNTFLDLIKTKDDSAKFLPVQLTVICCLGAIYERLGRMVGTLYDEGWMSLNKLLNKAEPATKCEILLCFEKMLMGMGIAGNSGFKDIHKACKLGIVDKSMSVRWAAAKCVLELSKHHSILCSNDLETTINMCFKALEGSNYDVRLQVAELIGTLMTSSQSLDLSLPGNSKLKKVPIEEIFSLMAAGFLRGGTGFLKSGEGLSREVRVGVTQAYVVMFREFGTKWISKHIPAVMMQILDLVSSPKAVPDHISAVYSRKCIYFILNSVFCGMLPETQQVRAVQELCKIITKQMNAIHTILTNDPASNGSDSVDIIMTQHVLVCALEELSNLIQAVTSSVKVLLKQIIEAVFSTLIHPAPAVWLAAAWCVRCCTVSIPSCLTELIDTCISKMTKLKGSSEAVTGYGYTLASVIGGLYQCPLGMPYGKVKTLFTLTDELLLSSSQSGKLALCKVQTGWVMMGALCTLGSAVMRECMPRLVQLWTSSFPASTKDLETEKSQGSVATWQLTLENRAGVLSSMTSFLIYCKEIINPDLLKKMLAPIEIALQSLPMMPGIIKLQGAILKPCSAMFKVRLYTLLKQIDPKLFEGSFTPLLRELVAEFTLADHRGNTTTSLLQSLCHEDDSVLLGSGLLETDHKDVEEQLLSNSASGSGALEHDSTCVYARCSEKQVPGPLPLGVSVIDASIMLFGHAFPCVAQKHRGQLMDHFNECILKTKGARQQAIQTNIFSAFLSALKNLSDTKVGLGESTVRKAASQLVQDALRNPDNTLRCAAGEALGRMGQVVNDPDFIASTVQKSFETCQKVSDAVVRTGHSLALGCLHRYVGSMGSGQHLNNSVSILIALAKDEASKIVQIWALHGLTLISDSGGPMFRSYVEESLSTVVNLMLRTSPSFTEVHQCLGKCIGALITAIGPELQDNSKAMVRNQLFCMNAISIMTHHPDSQVQSEAIRCLQQMHLFAPNVVNLTNLVPKLCKLLLSPHLLLRRGSVGCIRQLVLREAKGVCEQALKVIQDNEDVKKRMFISERGLEGLLFSLLDSEVHPGLQKHLREILVSLLQELAADNLPHWLGLCKQVLLASKPEEIINEEVAPGKDDKDNEDEGDDDEEGGQIVNQKMKSENRPNMTPKWPTRVFAMECVRKIFEVCRVREEHMDLTMARKLKVNKQRPKGSYLVQQLAELVRITFIAGTSSNELLKFEGMNALQDVVVIFARVQDPDIHGQLILEQFQAQVGTALRPAFEKDVPPNITAMACEVCSSWIGCGISRDINDVRRIQQLLVQSLNKITTNKSIQQNIIYSEAAYTSETLAVLKAWAQIYIMAVKHENSPPVTSSIGNSDGEGREREEEDHQSSSLLSLIEEELAQLARNWICALRDYVYLMLPSEYAPQLPAEGGTFYSGNTTDAVRLHYKQAWPPMALAVALWLNNCSFNDKNKIFVGASDEIAPPTVQASTYDTTPDGINRARFHLVCGICIEAVCAPSGVYRDGTTQLCVSSIKILLDSKFGREKIASDKDLIIELLTVMHRVFLTNDQDFGLQESILNVVSKCSQAFLECIKDPPSRYSSPRPDDLDDSPTHSEPEPDLYDLREGQIEQKKSVVYCLLEICLLVANTHARDVMPRPLNRSQQRNKPFCPDTLKLLVHVSEILSNIPVMCRPSSIIAVMPSVMFLNMSLFKFICMSSSSDSSTCELNAILKAETGKVVRSFKSILVCEHSHDEMVEKNWKKIIESSVVSLLEIPKICVPCTISPSSSDNPSQQQVQLANQLVIWESIILCMSVFIVHTSVFLHYGSSSTLHACIQVFIDCLDTRNAKLMTHTIKMIESMIKSSETQISIPFIRSCIPKIVGILENAQTEQPTCEVELNVRKQSVVILEYMLQTVDETNRVPVMSIYIPALVLLLHDTSSLPKANSFSRSLQEYCIQRLNVTGPLYQKAFKSIMAASPDLRGKLAQAIKANADLKRTRTNSASGKKDTPAIPQIALKMDFSNFKR